MPRPEQLSIRFPNSVLEIIDELVENGPWKDRLEFIRESVNEHKNRENFTIRIPLKENSTKLTVELPTKTFSSPHLDPKKKLNKSRFVLGCVQHHINTSPKASEVFRKTRL